VYVAPQRYQAGLLAESEAAPASSTVHLLDDGFQHRQLHRDVNILLLSARDLRDSLLPAGNLREPLHATVRAHVIAIAADEPEVESELRKGGWLGPVWRLRRHMDIPPVDAPVLAFCGIARPQQFFDGLRKASVDTARTRAFPDHHRYTPADLDRLTTQATRCGASVLLTTEKDAVRLEGFKSSLPVITAALRTEIEDESQAIKWLIARLHPPA
jgi:tetraacyldisaccharide 4'-kinase